VTTIETAAELQPHRFERAMRILITGSRMPFALDEIRKFGAEGHEVYAADTFRTSPGSHSRHVRERMIVASPTFDSRRFIEDVRAIVRSRRIDRIVPAFEEVFCIAKHADEFANDGTLFCSPFETMATLHAKHRFVDLATSLGLAVPETRTVTSATALRDACAHLDEYVARPSYSRGGVDLITNVGPRAGEHSIEGVRPTRERPWIVQRFVRGLDVCSFSVAHHGRVAAHATYIHPKTIEHTGGISFESVDDPDTLAITLRIVQALAYHGQISFDYMRTPDGLVLIECNPRPTAGVFVMDSSMLVEAILGRSNGAPHVVPAGRRLQIVSALIRDMFRDWRAIPSDLRTIFSGTPDVYIRGDDLGPGIYQLLSYSHVFSFRRKLHVERHSHWDLVAAQFYDLLWDGGEIP
jgi:predicted ATP-grasp superfamily ATP-dependent carboligase